MIDDKQFTFFRIAKNQAHVDQVILVQIVIKSKMFALQKIHVKMMAFVDRREVISNVIAPSDLRVIFANIVS